MERPIPIHRALERFSPEALPTIAAFMLLAGIWHRAEYERSPIVPRDDLEAAGFGDWTRETTARGKPRLPSFADDGIADAELGKLFDHDGSDFAAGSGPADEREGRGEHDKLATAIHRALSTGRKKDTAEALVAALSSPWPILRTCARISAMDFFSWTARDIQWLRFAVIQDLRVVSNWTTIDRNPLLHDLHRSLAQVLAAKLGFINFPPWSWPRQTLPSHSSRPVSPTGLMLIHGTMFENSTPEWSIPGSGRLFQHIQSFRPDVYSHDDYFAWEGSYSGYGRDMAARNLLRWVQNRQLTGIDAVTHSHGGNVLIQATTKGCRFGDVLLLSCPVRKEYKLDRKAVRSARSVRIRCDLVLLADRARQRFPKSSGISETVLPNWFRSHSATTEPKTWQRYGIRI